VVDEDSPSVSQLKDAWHEAARAAAFAERLTSVASDAVEQARADVIAAAEVARLADETAAAALRAATKAKAAYRRAAEERDGP